MPRRRTRDPLAGLSLAELRRAVEVRMAGELKVLQQREAALETELAAVRRDRQALERPFGGIATRRGTRLSAAVRTRRSGTRSKPDGGGRRPNLRDLAAEILQEAGKPLHQREIAQRLQETKQVRSSSAHFDRSLGLALSKDPRFSRPGRAIYALKGTRPGAASPKQASKGPQSASGRKRRAGKVARRPRRRVATKTEPST